MTLEITDELMRKIHAHGEAAYPDEGAGLLLGQGYAGSDKDSSCKQVTAILPLDNSREDAARHNRYLLTARDYQRGEVEAARQGLDVLGVFHSHPDHPNRPSEFDREWAMPWFSYIITSVQAGKAASSCSWLLTEDRLAFEQEEMVISA